MIAGAGRTLTLTSASGLSGFGASVVSPPPAGTSAEVGGEFEGSGRLGARVTTASIFLRSRGALPRKKSLPTRGPTNKNPMAATKIGTTRYFASHPKGVRREGIGSLYRR